MRKKINARKGDTTMKLTRLNFGARHEDDPLFARRQAALDAREHGELYDDFDDEDFIPECSIDDEDDITIESQKEAE